MEKPVFIQPSIYLTEEEKIAAAQEWLASLNNNNI